MFSNFCINHSIEIRKTAEKNSAAGYRNLKNDQIKQIVQDENEYVAQQHFLIGLLQPNVFFLSQPWLKGFNGQYGTAAQTTGPFMAYHYYARFWISQSAE